MLQHDSRGLNTDSQPFKSAALHKIRSKGQETINRSHEQWVIYDDLWVVSTTNFRIFRTINKKLPRSFEIFKVFAEKPIITRDLVYKSVWLMSSLSLEERPWAQDPQDPPRLECVEWLCSDKLVWCVEITCFTRLNVPVLLTSIYGLPRCLKSGHLKLVHVAIRGNDLEIPVLEIATRWSHTSSTPACRLCHFARFVF